MEETKDIQQPSQHQNNEDTQNTGHKAERGSTGNRGDRGGRGQRGDKGGRGQRGDRGGRGQRGDRGGRGQRGDRGGRGQRGDKGGRGQRDDIGGRGQRGDRGHRGQRGDRGGRGGQGHRGGRGQPRGGNMNENYRGQQMRDRHSNNGHRGGHGAGGKANEQNVDKNYYNYNNQTQNQGPRQGDYRNHQHQRQQRQINAQNRNINAPKDSFYTKYYYGPYPTIEEIKVELDTEIPSINEEDLIELPSGDEYAKYMRDCDEQIQQLRHKITEINDQKKQKSVTKREEQYENNKEEVVDTQGKSFKQLCNERNKLQNERKELNEVAEKFNSKMEVINTEIRKVSKNIDLSMKTEVDVDEKIEDLNHTLTTQTIPVAKQKELFKKVQFLEKSKPHYKTFELLQAKLKEAKGNQYKEKLKIWELTKQIKGYKHTLDVMNEENKAKRQDKDKFSEELQKLEDKVHDVKKEIGTLFEKKNEIREQHYKKLFTHEVQKEQIAYYQHLQLQKDHLIAKNKEQMKYVEEKQRQEEEKLEKMKSMPNPFSDEINQCAYLISQLRLKKRDHENYIVKAEMEVKRREDDAERKKEIEKKEEEGKIQVYQKEEDPLPVGKKQKKKQKQQQMKQAPAPAQKDKTDATVSTKPKIDFKYDVVKGLLELGVDVPEHKAEEIDHTIDRLTQLKENYEAKGNMKIQDLFKSGNWQEKYEKQLQAPEEEFLLHEEEEEQVYEEKPKQRKKQKYVRDDVNDKPLE